jgi:hypothetical protein
MRPETAGWATWAGADYRYGREAASQYDEGWDKYGDLWSPKEADNRVMGTSVLWNSERTNQRQDFPKVPWAMPVSGKHVASKGEWYWEYSDNDLNQVDDAKKFAITCCVQYLAHFPMLRKILNMLQIN